jgi:hypothetical protein
MTHECSCRRFSANQFGLLKHGLRGLFLLVWRITLFPLRRLSRHGDVMGVAIMPSRILVLSIRWQARARHAGASRVLQNAPDAAGQCGRSPPYCGHTRFGSCRFGWIKMSSPSALRRTIDREWTCPRFWWHFRRFGRASAPDRDPPNQAGHTVNTVKPSVDMLETDLFPTNSISAQV